MHSRRKIISLAIGATILCVGSGAFAAIVSGAFTTASSAQVTTTVLTLNKPASSSGDLLLATISIRGGTSANVSAVPAGWTELRRTDNSSNIVLISYYKIASGSEPSNYKWVIDGQTTAEGSIIAYSGVDIASPIDQSSGNIGFGSTATALSVTTTAANEEVVAIFAVDEGKNTSSGSYFNTPAGMTEKYDVTNIPFGPSMAADEVLQATAGPAGSKSSTISGGNKPRNWVAQQIALRQLSPVPTVNGPLTTLGIEDNNAMTTATFSHTINPGNNQILIVTGGAQSGGEDVSATYGGIPMTEGRAHGTDGFVYHDYWYLVNPPEGAHDVVINFPLSGGRQYAAITISNADQILPFDQDSHAGGSNFGPAPDAAANVAVTSTEPNELILYFLDFGGSNATYIPADSQLYSVRANYANTGAVRLLQSPGTVNVGGIVSRNGGGSVWEIVAIPIRPAN